MTHDAEVIIIGAGLAGLAAARELMKHNRSVIVLEARNRIGGRAYTDNTTFGVPFDHGCSWVHSPEISPLRRLVKACGLDLMPDNSYSCYIGRRKIYKSEKALLARAERSLDKAIRDLATDVSLSDALIGNEDQYAHTAARYMAFVAGLDVEQVSTKAILEEVGVMSNEIVRQGLGTFVACYGNSIPVRLNTIVTHIDYTGKDVVVTTNDGSIRAKKVIITVPIGVLINSRIKFTPSLPVAQQEGIDGLQMGCFNKIACLFREKIPKFEESHYAIIKQDPVVATTLNSYGSGLSVTFVSGSLARDLEKAGEQAAIDYALNALSDVMGSRIKQSYVKGIATSWGHDEFSYGSYSGAKPGYAHMRARLREPVSDRVFFAGEACHSKWMTHLAGAYLSGVETARLVVKLIPF